MMKTQKKSKLTMSQLVLTAVILVLSLVCFLPVVNVIAISLSSKSPILRGEVTFLPVELNFKAYEAIFKDPSMITSLFFTVKITVIYTVLAMILTVLLAYPLALRRFKGQKIISLFVIFTMYFSGGTIPIYLNIKELGMLNTQWALILPGVISTFNVLLMRNFFNALPYEMNEAAYIDVATDFQVLLRIYLPLSLSSIATLSLFYAVGKWNSFSDALYYTTSRDLQPLQLKLYNLIKGNQSIELSAFEGNSNNINSEITESLESATIIFATLPILIVYPFVQRYFVAGVASGAVKG